MSARAKIEWITNNWYGLAVASAIISVLSSGFGVLSILFNGTALMFSLGLIWFFGKALLGKSSLTRMFLLVVSVLGILAQGIFLAKTVMTFLVTWKFGLIIEGAAAMLGIVMFGRSFRALTDKAVKTYFAS